MSQHTMLSTNPTRLAPDFYTGKQVVIVGGTSGLGRELALQLESLGARVAVIARGAIALDQVHQQAPALIPITGDISDKQQIYPLAGTLHAHFDRIDYLFNVASTLGPTPMPLLIDTACEDLEQVLATNLMGPFRLIKALLPTMLLHQEGTVVNISSDAAVSAYPNWGAYGISKAALDHLSRIFAEELREQGIRFWAVDPGDMRTPMHFAAVPDADPEALKDPALAARQLLQFLSQATADDATRQVL